jgi:hypothetical protein
MVETARRIAAALEECGIVFVENGVLYPPPSDT